MKQKSSYIQNVFNLMILSLLSISFCTLFLGCKESQKPVSTLGAESIVSSLAQTIQYADYSTVDWLEVDSMFYRPYQCDWETTFPKLNLTEDFPNQVACEKWHLLQNAKKDFHLKTAVARTINNEETRLALLHVESAFDSVFYYFTKDEFYMRSFIDHYNPIMSKAFDDLTITINKE
jgi:hypothetical protein